ncbi:transcription elongation factor GreB [Geoalkalibacter subterraneus]|uniref:Transcription elongation factor GreB n=1 Tax=Geoalkalibacter subterraneus TaxID=483547 RepID=A0A0B5FD72_9BACT|nr:transcription elongation factor GreB [Geoalkalibacter subterraneus]AJF06082.1 transcription elongation factor GreB [Geoalkalibacter subterraneus]
MSQQRKNYMTPGCAARMRAELKELLYKERPAMVDTVAWAASNGDRSENADYQYGKRRLREIDRRIRFLTKQLDAADIVDPLDQKARAGDRVLFGATVTVENADGVERVLSLVGGDEMDASRGRISWFSPVGRALLNAREGDEVTVVTPGGREELEIVKVDYLPLD